MNPVESPQELEGYTFEKALEELESIVSKLEQGHISLEEMVRLYARGKLLSDFCSRKLQAAEEQIRRLESVSETEPPRENDAPSTPRTSETPDAPT